MSEARKYEPWHVRMDVEIVKTVEGEEGFRYELGRKVDEAGGEWIYIAKVTPSGYAKSILRLPKKIAKTIAEALAEITK